MFGCCVAREDAWIVRDPKCPGPAVGVLQNTSKRLGEWESACALPRELWSVRLCMRVDKRDAGTHHDICRRVTTDTSGPRSE